MFSCGLRRIQGVLGHVVQGTFQECQCDSGELIEYFTGSHGDSGAVQGASGWL